MQIHFGNNISTSYQGIMLLNAPSWLAMTDDAQWVTPLPPGE